MSAAVVAAWLCLGAILVVSGAAKVPARRAEESTAALARHGVVLAPTAVRCTAVLELALGAALLLAAGPALVVSAGSTLLLLVGYTALVVTMLRAGGSGGCGCHGDDAGRTTWRTLARNLVLVGLAVLVLARAASGDGWPALMAGLGAVPRVAVVVAGLLPAAVLATRLALRARRAGRVDPVPPMVIEPLPAEPDDYVRWPVPHAPLHELDGSRTDLARLADAGARFALLLDAAADEPAELRAWLHTAEAWAPAVTPAVVLSGGGPTTGAAGVQDLAAPVLLDRTGAAAVMLGIRALPAAVLLGADGWLAAGPAEGAERVAELVAAIAAELAAEGVEETPPIRA